MWKVKFNADKSCSILFSPTQNLNVPALIFNVDSIKMVNKHKHLGVFLTATLDWSKQIHEVCLKANRKLAMLRNVHYLQRKTLDLLYKVIVRSVTDYALPLYYSSLSISQKKQL